MAFVADSALMDKQIQQNYPPAMAHAVRPLLLSEFRARYLWEFFYEGKDSHETRY
jgi:hypothetical protein